MRVLKKLLLEMLVFFVVTVTGGLCFYGYFMLGVWLGGLTNTFTGVVIQLALGSVVMVILPYVYRYLKGRSYMVYFKAKKEN